MEPTNIYSDISPDRPILEIEIQQQWNEISSEQIACELIAKRRKMTINRLIAHTNTQKLLQELGLEPQGDKVRLNQIKQPQWAVILDRLRADDKFIS